MYLTKGRCLVLKPHKPSIPFLLRNAIPNQNQARIAVVTESEVLQRVRNERDVFSAMDFFKTLANSGAFKHTALTYHAMIERLGRGREFDAVQYLLNQMKIDGVPCSEDLFAVVIGSYRRSGLSDPPLRMLYRLREFGCEPTVKIYNLVLDCLLGEKRFNMIYPIYSNMKRDGIEPNVFTFNVLIKALSQNDRVEHACKLFDEMSNRGISPDSVSYTTVVSSLCKLGRVDEAREISRRFDPVLPVYNALMNGLCKENRVEEALEILNVIKSKGMDPNVITYSTIISGLCNIGCIDSSLAILASMFVKGCDPNSHTFSSLIKGLLQENRVREALRLWDRIIEPNVVAYGSLIQGLCSAGKVDKALAFLHEMERNPNPNLAPNVQVYASLIDAFAKRCNLSDAAEIWNRMMIRGTRPNAVAYTCMVGALSRASMFDEARSLIASMAAEDCPPNAVTFNSLVKGLCSDGKPDRALRVLEEFKLFGCEPNVTTYNELLDGLFKAKRVREAFRLFKEMEEKGIRFNRVTCNTILHGFVRSDLPKKAFELLGKMFTEGESLDGITYNVIVHGYCELGKIDRAVQMFERSESEWDRWRPDVTSYTSLVNGICKTSGLEKSMVYVEKMVSRGVSPNVATWNLLVRCLFDSLSLEKSQACYSTLSLASSELIIEAQCRLRDELSSESRFNQEKKTIPLSSSLLSLGYHNTIKKEEKICLLELTRVSQYTY